MKRFLTYLFALLFASSAMAGSYTITFKDSGNDTDATSSMTSTLVSDYVASGADYVSAVAPSGKVYLAKTGAGLKFGNSSNGGSLTMTLKTPVKPTSIVVSASQFNASEGKGLFQGQEFDMTGGGGKYSFNDYTVNYDGATEVTTISVGTEKRGYVKSVTVNFEGEATDEPGDEPGETHELKAVEASTTWDFSKITANTSNALYSSEGIRLTDESIPSKNEEVIYADYTEEFMTIGADFDGEAMAFKGEYPIRKNKYCQAGTLHFKTTVPGSIKVKFSDTGSSASASAVKRYLVVNGEQTEYWTSRENNGADAPYDAQLDVTTGAIAVPAGDVTITGSSAIVVYTVEFTAEEPVIAEPISCADVYSLDKDAEITLNPVTVTYANGKNVYVKDATGSMLLYLPAPAEYAAGNVLSGVAGTVDIYNGLYEVKPTAAQVEAITAEPGEAPAPEELTAVPTSADMNKYVLLKGITFETTDFVSKNITATMGEETFVLRNSFNLTQSFDTEKTYDIVGAVAIYNSTIQVYLISATEVASEPADPSVLFEGEYNVSWESPMSFDANKFANAKAGDRIVVTYKEATGDIEFKVLNDEFSHLAGSREALHLDNGDGEHTLEQFLTPTAVESIKTYGLQLIGSQFTVTKIELKDGKELKEGATVWTGYFWADEWSTLELYKEGYSDIDLSEYDAIRFYTEAAGTEYVINFMSDWGGEGIIADQSTMTDGEGYKELVLTDELRTKMSNADHWMIQFNKEELEAFNATDIVLVKKLADPTNCAEAAEAALSVSANNELYNDGKEYTIEGYVTAIQTAFNAEYSNVSFWMADEVNGGNVIQAFRAVCATAEDAPAVGDKVAVTGKLTKYNDTPEFAAGCTFVITEKAPVVEPQDLGEKTIEEFLALKNTVDFCTLKGTVSNITNETYGNFDLTDETGTVFIYGLLTADGEAQKFAELNVAENDTLTLKATYSEYNGAPQVKNAVFVEVKKYEEPVVDGIGIVATENKSGKAVKVLRNGQLLIEKDGKTYNAQGQIVK